MDFKNLSLRQIVLFIAVIILIFSVLYYLVLIFLSSQSTGCSECTRVVAGSCHKYNITTQNHTERWILINYLGGQDAEHVKELSIVVNNAEQPISLGIVPGSYVVVSGTSQSNHVTGNALFIDNRHQIFIDMDYSESASVIKKGENITINFDSNRYYDDNLTVMLNNIRQPVQLTANGTYTTIQGTIGKDHLEVFSEREVPPELRAHRSPKRYFIDTYI